MGPRRRIVGCPQGLTRRFVLLTVVHATGSKGLPSPDIVTRRSLPTSVAAEDDECSKGNEPETHGNDGNDETDDETVVLTTFTGVEVTLHTVVISGVDVALVGGGGWIGTGSRLGWVSLLTGTVDATAFGAFFNGEGDVIRDGIEIFLDVGLTDAKSSGKDVRGQIMESLSDLGNTWERITEARDEGCRFTLVVVLEVDSTHREESGLVCFDLVIYESGTVLPDETGDKSAIGDVIDFCRPRVDVRGVVSTCAKVTNSDRDVVPDGRGHGQDIGRGAESTCADSFSWVCVHEIELEIPVRKELDPFNGCRGLHEICDEPGIDILSGDGGESDCGKNEEF